MEDGRRHIVPIIPIVAIDRVLKRINVGFGLDFTLLGFYLSPEGTGWLRWDGMGDYNISIIILCIEPNLLCPIPTWPLSLSCL